LNQAHARRATAAALAATALAATLAAAGCDRGGDEAAPPSPVETEAAEAGYLAPPAVSAVQVAGGRIVIEGAGPRGDRVRLVEAGGGAYGGTVGADGRWRLEAPRGEGPRLYTVSALGDGRTLQAEGRLLVLPDGRALLLRPGHGALPVGGGSGAGAPRITSVDVASDGAAAVSGFARPGARAVTLVDGAPPPENVVVGQGAADADGRFAIILAGPLPPGAHALVVNTPDGVARAEVTVAAAADPGARALVAERQPQGWRIAWRLPRGGVQTTYVLGAAA
jgi:hypothetical protein